MVGSDPQQLLSPELRFYDAISDFIFGFGSFFLGGFDFEILLVSRWPDFCYFPISQKRSRLAELAPKTGESSPNEQQGLD